MAKGFDWFCWELDFSGKPCPVIYYDYDELPNKRGLTRVLTVKLDPRLKSPIDGEYSLSALAKAYPYISQQESIDITTAPVVEETEQENTDGETS